MEKSSAVEDQYPPIEAVCWENLRADIFLSQHGTTTQLYMSKVILPSIDALQLTLSDLAVSADPAAPFFAKDLEDVLRATLQAFALSLQSLWERQFRAYIVDVSKERGMGRQYIFDVRRCSWESLCQKFEELKGVSLRAFDSFEALSLLQLIGNACRHGEGYSADKLRSDYPELWPKWPPDESGFWDRIPPPGAFPVEDILISNKLLQDLATAVIWFWEDHEYIYTNSIVNKAPVVEETLNNWRNRRAGRDFQELKLLKRR